ncbi:MAG: hypothetical protein M1820_002514 [Bogoriella megaspora]|nr:MAG: hypothetical protein M1820_002514 [Bogoriella megaspora]
MDATVFSLQYGYPLTAYASLAQPLLLLNSVNRLVSTNELANPSNEIIIRPNDDTIYASTVYDLSERNVEITVPDIGLDRYWSVTEFDPFGENWAVIGYTNNNTGGQYLLRRAYTGGSCDSKYQGCVNSPTTDGTLLQRVLVKDNGSDLTYVQGVIRGTKTVEVNRTSTCKDFAATPLTNDTFAGLPNDTALAILELLARLEQNNPPSDTNLTGYVDSQLRAAGIRDGKYRKPPGVNITEAALKFQANLENYAATGAQALGNGWERYVPQGTYGSDYTARAFAVFGYLENRETQALYPQYGESNFNLNDDEAYLYTFSSKPPLGDGGFWSLTMYNSSGFFVANPKNVYAVGDRSNITYANGDLVCGVNSSATENESFQILVQSYDVAPPSNWTANWLPAPAGGASFSVTLRFYVPTDALVNGGWTYPIMTKTSAKRG